MLTRYVVRTKPYKLQQIDYLVIELYKYNLIYFDQFKQK